VLAEDVPGCGEFEVWLGLYLDGELAVDECAKFEAHLSSCERCQAELKLLERSRTHMRRQADLSRAPEGLSERVGGAIHQAAKHEGRGQRRLVIGGLATLLVIGSAVVVFNNRGAVLAPASAGDSEEAASVVNASVSQHELELPVDVASADAARVETFVRSRVGRAVDVPRLESQGFSLRGGRVVSLENRPAAQLVYQGGLGRRVSVTAVPDVDERVSNAAVDSTNAPNAQYKAPVRAVRVGSTLYTVVGDVSVDTMRALSENIAAQGVQR